MIRANKLIPRLYLMIIKLTNWEKSSIYSEGSSEGVCILKIIPMLMQNCECICYLKIISIIAVKKIYLMILLRVRTAYLFLEL